MLVALRCMDLSYLCISISELSVSSTDNVREVEDSKELRGRGSAAYGWLTSVGLLELLLSLTGLTGCVVRPVVSRPPNVL